jgi:ribosomal protein L11 methyltransferase
VRPADAEEARARLLALVPEGFEESEDEDTVILRAYVRDDGEARVQASFPGAVAEPVAPGWDEAWKRFHRPARVGPLWVGPPWERPDPDALSVVIDPGRAFGTGAHATTRLCLELLVDTERGSLADLGCGSGVLAIAAARLGFAPVVALDSDPAAVAAAAANARANRVDVDVKEADVVASAPAAVDVAVANIGFEEVQALAARVRARTLVTSGYLASQVPSLSGWRLAERREADGWVADRFEPS